VRRRLSRGGEFPKGAGAEPPHLRQAQAFVVGFRGHASRSPASRALAFGGAGLGPLGRHDPAGGKRLVERFGDLRRRVGAVLEINAVLAGQAGEGDPEPAQLCRRDLERGGGQVVHVNRSASDRGHCQKRRITAVLENSPAPVSGKVDSVKRAAMRLDNSRATARTSSRRNS
jgi:hypothetical protein